jgi:hypothetical protein
MANSGKEVITTYKEDLKHPLAEKYIEVQIREIQLRERELEFKKKQDENNYDYARESLKFQSEDLKNRRNHETKKEKQGLLIICSVIMMFFAVIVVALFLDKDQLLSDIIRSAGYIFGGGITGYGIGLQKGKTRSKSKP